ncbi:pyridoxal phosphate-dependent transferase [Gamsiella multidivaricata]|uniref:pyridoxal phosphate-dependent transferase n=1 Tax=Gamsiella multidivaricata TaxID=101098 RepID=UPI00221F4284|nr:pyridoxal phosphate-dependent transferase [Gamsiella multidivaricata]KAG0355040.1 Threonine aldolase [Gamsiella multidivaricata]KAI7830390.1 pyridoxal phosphate-dependent transferase [Gamsiella multidivaricata]
MSTPKSINPLPYSDFRSDTATAPTPEMFAAMMKASLGDDVYNEDDSVKNLERYVATLCGHEAALFCSSGTMTNQLAHRVHLCNPPQSAMVDIRSHVFNYEAGGISFHSQAAVYPVMPSNGKYLTVEDIAPRLVHDIDVHYAPTRVISLENTLNGTIMPIKEIERIRALTKEHGIKLHLDGARLWHASIATGISLKEYCSHFDTVSLCLSKGIGAPIGSILIGSEIAIKKARHFRLLFGGGWRQAGILAEAALWGIKTNWPTMEDTHRRAKWLERVFVEAGCHITNPVETNMIWVDTTDAGFTVEELMTELAKEGIKISGSGLAARVVLHYQITDDAVQRFIQVIHRLSDMINLKVNTGFVEVSMHEQPSGAYEGQQQQLMEAEIMTLDTLDMPMTPLTPTISVVPRVLKSSAACNDDEEMARRHSEPIMSNMKRCLFEEHPGDPIPEILQPASRKVRRAFSSRSNQEQVFCDYQRHDDMSDCEEQYQHQRHQQQQLPQIKMRPNQQRYSKVTIERMDEDETDRRRLAPIQRRQNELEPEREGRNVTMVGRLARSKSVDYHVLESRNGEKKKKKIGLRISQSPASMALKRASHRIAHWSGSFLTREA